MSAQGNLKERNDRRHARWLTPALFAWSTLLTILLYGRALELPFFFDDFVHLPYVDSHSIPQMVRSAGNLAYYRPLTFVVWKAMSYTTGGHNAALQHGLNLLLHLMNGFLVGLLARTLWGDRSSIEGRVLQPLLATTAFLCFPFSFQAVPWIDSASHLLATLLILIAILAFWQWRRRKRGRWPWLALSMLATLLALFTHENGILVLPLLAVVVLTDPVPDEALPARLRSLLLWALPVLIWLPLWWTTPKATDGSISIRGFETIVQNITYFLQGIAYPTTWLGRSLVAHTGLSDFAAVWLLSVVALGSALLVQVRAGKGRRRWLPWLWMAAATLPATLFLSFDYVINGPRLLMLASVGSALLWSDVATTLVGYARRRAQPAWNFLLLRATTIVLSQNVFFIGRLMRYHLILGRASDQVTSATLAANRAGDTALFINLPSWLAPPDPPYALGHVGVQFWPDYAPQEARVAVQTGVPADLMLRRVDGLRDTPPYFYGVSGDPLDWQLRNRDHLRVFIARYTAEAISIQLARAMPATPTAGAPLVAFAEGDAAPALALAAATTSVQDGDLILSLNWRAQQSPPDVTVFVHLVDEAGNLLAQADGDPLAGSYPFAQWQPGQLVVDIRYLPSLPEARTVRLGLYRRSDGQRLFAALAGDQPVQDKALVLPIPRP